jgi:hypothetical protein
MGSKIRIFIIILFLLATCVGGCGVTSNSNLIQNDSTRVELRYLHDTLISHKIDSVFVNQYMRGDTVFRDKVSERIRYRDRIVYQKDTVVRYKINTQIVKQETVKKIVPKWCWYLLAANLLIVAFFALKTYLKWKKI